MKPSPGGRQQQPLRLDVQGDKGWTLVGVGGRHVVAKGTTRSNSRAGENRDAGVAAVMTRSLAWSVNTAAGDTMEPTEFERLQGRVAEHGREAKDVGAGGLCQYQAFAHQIRTRFRHLFWGASTCTWQQVCSHMADWLARNKVHGGVDLSETLVTGVEWDGHSWDDYVNRVRQGRVWGNELTIHAFVHFSKTPVRVWTSRKGDEVVWNEINPVGYDSTHPVTAIDLGHVVENHYVSVIQRRDVPGQDKEDDTVVRGSPGDSNGPLWVHFADGIPASTNGGKKRTRTSPVTSPHNTSPLSGPAKRGRGLGTRSQTGAVRGAESDAVMAEAVTEEVRSCGICGTSAEPCKLQDNVWVCVDCAKDFNYWSVLSEPNDTDWKPPGKGSVSEVSTKQDLSRASSPIQGLGGGAAGGGVKDIGAVQGVSVQKNRAAVTTSATVDTSESSLQGAVQPQGPTGLAPPDVSRQQEVMRGNRRSPSPVAKGRRGSGNNSVTGNGRGRSSTSLDPVIMEEEGFTAESPPMPHDHVQYRSTDQVTGVVSWLDAVVESVDHSLSPPTVMLLILEEGSLGRPRETELDHLRKSSPSDLGGHSSADILPDFSGVYYQGGSGTGFGGGFKTTRACKTLLDYLGGGALMPKPKPSSTTLRLCGLRPPVRRSSTGRGPSASWQTSWGRQRWGRQSTGVSSASS
jgi:hypothetical protein